MPAADQPQLAILGFGALKYVPGASPAEPLVMRTVDALTFGVVSGTPAVVATVVETAIGLILITGIGLRLGPALTASIDPNSPVTYRGLMTVVGIDRGAAGRTGPDPGPAPPQPAQRVRAAAGGWAARREHFGG